MTNTALSLSDNTLQQTVGVRAGDVQELTYTLNLNTSNLKINSQAANNHTDSDWANDTNGDVRKDEETGEQVQGAQRLGTITFTFGEYTCKGNLTSTSKSITVTDNYEGLLYSSTTGVTDASYSSATTFYLRDNSTEEVYSLSQVKQMADDLSAGATLNTKTDEYSTDSIYAPMFIKFATSHEGSTSNCAYECRTRWYAANAVGSTATSKSTYFTEDKFTTYRLKILDIVRDIKTNNKPAGITFQLANSYNSTIYADHSAWDNESTYFTTGFNYTLSLHTELYNRSSSGTHEIYDAAISGLGSKNIETVNKLCGSASNNTDANAVFSMSCDLFDLSLCEIEDMSLYASLDVSSASGIDPITYPWLCHEGYGDTYSAVVTHPYRFYSSISGYSDRTTKYFNAQLLDFEITENSYVDATTYSVSAALRSPSTGTKIYGSSTSAVPQGVLSLLYINYNSVVANYQDHYLAMNNHYWYNLMYPAFCF